MNKITIDNYQLLAMRTCLPSCRNKEYAYYGYISEWHEYRSKVYGYFAKKIRGDSEEKLLQVREQIKGELGDCFWFIALKCELEGIDFAEIFRLKTAITNSDIAEEKLKITSACLGCKMDVLDVLQYNIDKLASRAERGVIKGNGDER
jgi:hypothetical protein